MRRTVDPETDRRARELLASLPDKGKLQMLAALMATGDRQQAVESDRAMRCREPGWQRELLRFKMMQAATAETYRLDRALRGLEPKENEATAAYVKTLVAEANALQLARARADRKQERKIARRMKGFRR